MSDVVLEALNISKFFGGVRAVDDVSLRVKRGSIHAVIGPNGAGKTTFFNALSGFYFPDSGTVRFNGADVTRELNWKRVARGIGRTFQTPSVFPELSVHHNLLIGTQAERGIAFHFSLPGRTQHREIEERIDELLGFVNLGNVKHRLVAELSHGSQRLVEIAVSLSTNPQLVLLDEPMAGLAEADTVRVVNVIRDLRDRLGLTVLFVEHNMRVVLSLSHYVTVMNRGRILAEGTPQAIAANSVVREAYLGSEVIANV
ncbi:MAG TPA: ABC transporter ATP-binding protein [Candidatus Baltobacteraceae bacterium]|jgi:branched-chain amino acid transport system ATP-binding protein|nr:ABC transporter ATP-binding protein [Candidatus Baltobacteraceae bacterium]